MKRTIFAAILLALGSQAMAATCTSTTPWSSLGPPGSQNFGQTFNSVGSYTDCYTFSLSAAAASSGTTTELNFAWDKLWIDVTSVSLFSGGISSGSTTGAQVAADSTPGQFTFTNLSSGNYTMAVSSTVGQNWLYFNNKPVGYNGTISTIATGPIASAVPEADAYAMALVGFLGVGAAAARRRRRG